MYRSDGMVTAAPALFTDRAWEPWTPVQTPPLPRSICVRMTMGTFVGQYSGTALLHCGISDSKGRVFNFDERGIIAEETWSEAVCLRLQAIMHPRRLDDAAFDEELLKWHTRALLDNAPYHSTLNNCFDHVVRGVQHLTRSADVTKASLSLLLDPVMGEVAQYVDIVRCIQTFGDVRVQTAHMIDHHHSMAFLKSSQAFRCDKCFGQHNGHVARWRCAPCDIDFCIDCSSEHHPTRGGGHGPKN